MLAARNGRDPKKSIFYNFLKQAKKSESEEILTAARVTGLG
jgi:preprotein translocase subunit Sss1